MKPELKEIWVATLRSGNYEQGRRVLRNKDNECCCLGVLCDITHPSQWVTFGAACGYEIDDFSSFPSRRLRKEWGLSDEAAHELARQNDKGASFREIANWIERNIE